MANKAKQATKAVTAYDRVTLAMRSVRISSIS